MIVNFSCTLLVGLVFVIMTLVLYISRSVCLLFYWDRKKIRNLKPFKLENNEAAWMCHEMSRFQFYKRIYDEFVVDDYVGFFLKKNYVEIEPRLMIRNLQLIKIVLNKEFDKFSSRFSFTSNEDPFKFSLFNLDGTETWKRIRKNYLPVFSTGSLALIFKEMNASGYKLCKVVRQMMFNSNVIDVNIIARQYVMQIIASHVFGIDENIFENPNSKFVRMAKFIRRQSSMDLLPILSPQNWWTKENRDQKEALTYFRKLLLDVLEFRQIHDIKKPDILQFFIDLMKSSELEEGSCKDSHKWTFEDTFTHCLLFFLGGYTATSSVVSFALYELAKNPSVQETLRDEVRKTIKECHGQLCYDKIRQMRFLANVVSETMRKYPPFAVDIRVCTEKCTITEKQGISVTIDKGTTVIIPVSGLHYDPRYYPHPEKFDPDRFEESEISRRPMYSYLPFGEGPRSCIGKAFGLITVKIAIFHLISNFQLSVTPEDSQLKFLPGKFTTTANSLELLFKDK